MWLDVKSERGVNRERTRARSAAEARGVGALHLRPSIAAKGPCQALTARLPKLRRGGPHAGDELLAGARTQVEEPFPGDVEAEHRVRAGGPWRSHTADLSAPGWWRPRPRRRAFERCRPARPKRGSSGRSGRPGSPRRSRSSARRTDRLRPSRSERTSAVDLKARPLPPFEVLREKAIRRPSKSYARTSRRALLGPYSTLITRLSGRPGRLTNSPERQHQLRSHHGAPSGPQVS